MAVPMKKTSKRRSRTRASHHGLRAPSLSPCGRCNHPKPPHRVCPNCGYYAEREVVQKEQ